MIEMRSLRSIEQLIAIKRETLDEFRQDAARLNDVVKTIDQRFRQAVERSDQFVSETARNEGSGKIIDVNAMIGARQYLQKLQGLSADILHELQQAKARHEEAISQLKKTFTEVRALERLLERRHQAASIQATRKSYCAADDQEICRSASHGGRYADY